MPMISDADSCSFGDRLKRFRLGRNYSIEYLSIHCGILPMRLVLMENNGKKPSYQELVSLCNVLNHCPNDFMLSRHETQNPHPPL